MGDVKETLHFHTGKVCRNVLNNGAFWALYKHTVKCAYGANAGFRVWWSV